MTRLFATIGATFWKPKMCFVSARSVYFPVASTGSVEKMSPPVIFPWSIRVATGIVPSGTNLIFFSP